MKLSRQFQKDSRQQSRITKQSLIAGARALLQSEGKDLAARYLIGNLFRDRLDGSGEPYMGHLVRTGHGMKDQGRKYLGYLHDLLENIKGWTLKDLERIGFDKRDLAALDAVTKRPGEKYFDFVTRIGMNPDAIDIKLSDIRDNSDFLRMPPEKLHDTAWIENKQKYHLSYHYLLAIRNRQIASGTDFGLWLKDQPCWDKNCQFLERHSDTSILLKQPRTQGRKLAGPV